MPPDLWLGNLLGALTLFRKLVANQNYPPDPREQLL